MSTIRAIKARETLDGRGIPTLEVIVWIQDGRSVIVSVPTDLTYTSHQAKALRDNDQQEFNGMGVKKAIQNVNEVIGPQLLGMSTMQQAQVDQKLLQLDTSKDHSQLGANALLGVSMAVMKAGALSVNLPLYSYIQQKYQLSDYARIPSCIYNIIDGGNFGNGNLDFQEFQIIPASHINFPTSIAMASTIKQKMIDVIESKGGNVCTGPLGGFLPRMNSNKNVFELILEAVKTTTYTYAQDVFFGFDAAADDFATDSKYNLRDQQNSYSADSLLEFYSNIRESYKTIYVEDPFVRKDSKAWQKITKNMGATTKIAADHLLSGDLEELKKSIKDKVANTLVVKLLNRATISETIQLIKVAQDANWSVVISQHPGETNEDFLVDLAVGVGANYVKFGPPNRGEKIAKYNRMIRIQEEVGEE